MSDTLQERVSRWFGVELTYDAYEANNDDELANHLLEWVGLDPSMSVAELQSYIATGRAVMAEPEWPETRTELVTDWDGESQMETAKLIYRASSVNALLARLRAAGGVEQQGSEL